MKYLTGIYYVEVTFIRYIIQPNETIMLQKRDPSKSLRNQYQVQNETESRNNQKVVRIDKDELIGKKYPKK